MIGLCSHHRCESSGGDLEPRLFAVLSKNGRKTLDLVELGVLNSQGRDEIDGGFDLDGVGRADNTPCLHSKKGRNIA
ncbi:hypothetical protein D8674_042342 [Pyrus ussuriensis x Pyrus communis]|uniref:Uncharacterized protein n=1 Tax=Pyrus ussuriensis x Pyrus communis TaxID=2448454 RepID=A0A5N5G2I3_9ROSA|nr:hypothetical protein D8674_042342 [Pyrus ussuriensis x Pyrus communis]